MGNGPEFETSKSLDQSENSIINRSFARGKVLYNIVNPTTGKTPKQELIQLYKSNPGYFLGRVINVYTDGASNERAELKLDAAYAERLESLALPPLLVGPRRYQSVSGGVLNGVREVGKVLLPEKQYSSMLVGLEFADSLLPRNGSRADLLIAVAPIPGGAVGKLAKKYLPTVMHTVESWAERKLVHAVERSYFTGETAANNLVEQLALRAKRALGHDIAAETRENVLNKAARALESRISTSEGMLFDIFRPSVPYQAIVDIAHIPAEVRKGVPFEIFINYGAKKVQIGKSYGFIGVNDELGFRAGLFEKLKSLAGPLHSVQKLAKAEKPGVEIEYFANLEFRTERGSIFYKAHECDRAHPFKVDIKGKLPNNHGPNLMSLEDKQTYVLGY